MIRHVIVEGPDGAGKTTLLDFLCAVTPLVRHARASESVSGPVNDLGEWYRQDFAGMDEHQPSVYDRHPLISEPIYARYARREKAKHPFDDMPWLRKNREDVAAKTYVIWCMPPAHMVYVNAHSAPQMAGVRENIYDIYAAYRVLANSWPGRMTWYNYSTQSLPTILDRVKNSLNGALV